MDDSYVSVAGCWTASSDQHNILIDANATGAILVVAGGTIFNGGVLNTSDCGTGCNGLTALAGTFQLTGVDIRFNIGRGVWLPPSSVANGFSVTGCRVTNNGQGMNLAGGLGGFAVTGNVFSGNAIASAFGSQSNGAVVANNVTPMS